MAELVSLHLISLCIGTEESLKGASKQLKLKSGHLFCERDDVKTKTVRELLEQQKNPSRECEDWLQKVSDFEKRFRRLETELKGERGIYMLNFQKKMNQANRLKEMINEAAELLNKSPFQHRKSKRTRRMTDVKAQGNAKKPHSRYFHIKAESKSKKNVEASPAVEAEKLMKRIRRPRKYVERVAPPVYTSLQELEDNTRGRLAGEIEVSFEIEAQAVAVADLEDEKAPDLVHFSGIKDGGNCTIPSGSKDKSQMKTKQKKNLKWFVELMKSVAGPRSGPSNKAMRKPPMVTSSEKTNDEIAIDETETELNSRTRMLFEKPEKNAKKSIDDTVQKILGFMNDDSPKRVGIHGIGGIGKTTILKAVVNYGETKRMFNSIIWVSLTRSWSISKVQDVVAVQLGQSVLDSETNFAEKLSHDLQSRKFLLVLDNVWQTIDFGAIGIPFSSLKNGCMIIIATTLKDVCDAMAPDGKIEMKGLSWEEAWDLFREQVGGIIDSPDIQSFAQEIVAGCCYLPLLLIVIGKTLRQERDIPGWKLAAGAFCSAGSINPDDDEYVFRQLKFSYNRLKGPEVRSCFLYCALFPEGHNFKVEELVDYWIQEGLIVGHSADVPKKGLGVFNDLVDAALLERVDGGPCVKMHDVIRDLALWIISSEEDGHQFLAGANGSFSKPLEGEERTRLSDMDQVLLSRVHAGLTKPPPEEDWEQAKIIFLMDNDFSRLPERPNCPKLLMLFLHRNIRLRKLPSSFFDRMPSLQMLNLSKTKIRSLPPSLFELAVLKNLLLCCCEYLSELPPEIGNLKQLEVLDLWGTEIYSLPDEISKLSFLKLLQVCFYGSMDEWEYGRLPERLISHDILSKLQSLKKLSIVVHPGDPRWDTHANLFAQELCSLNELINLDFCFPAAYLLELFIQRNPSWKAGCLTKFKFVVGQNIKRIASRVPKNVEFHYEQEERCLRYVNGDTVNNGVKAVLMHATGFYLDHHCAISSLSEFGIANISQLKICLVRECPNILTIIDGRNRVTEDALPNLEHLSIHYLGNFMSIWEGQLAHESFNMLKTVSAYMS